MARGKRKETGAAQVAEGKKAKTGLHEGDALPELPVLHDEADNPVQLTEVVKGSGLVIFFFPKQGTGGCTKQARGFSEHVDDFEKAGYKVYGMSGDKPKSLAGWKEKEGLRFSLLSGTDEALKALGVKKGKSVQRSHIVVAPGGTLKNVSIGVKPAESVTDALAAVAGDGAVPQAEAAEADEEKKEAAAEEEPAAEDKKAEPEAMDTVAADKTAAEATQPAADPAINGAEHLEAAAAEGTEEPAAAAEGAVEPEASAAKGGRAMADAAEQPAATAAEAGKPKPMSAPAEGEAPQAEAGAGTDAAAAVTAGAEPTKVIADEGAPDKPAAASAAPA